MGFKLMDLIIKSDSNDIKSAPKKSEPKSSDKPKFPDSTKGIFNTDVPATYEPPTSVQRSSPNQPSYRHLDAIANAYDKHLEGLNLEGYDFWELYEAMSDLSPKTPETYKMAVHFATKMGENVDKNNLVQTAEYYEAEMNKFHDHQEQQGQVRLSQLNSNKSSDKSSLEREISTLSNQIESLKQEMLSKQRDLDSIDARYANQIADIEDKLATNTVARNAIIESIGEIKDGIKANIN